MLATGADVHVLRDPTRGGLKGVLCEIAARSGVGIEIDETKVPVKDAVRGACELLGIDPLLVANEGKLVAFVPSDGVDAVLAAMHAHPLGRDAAVIGHVSARDRRRVIAKTPIGGQRFIELPFAEALPRIC
jgi:hydrogenase expression/formation protein HypE